jgi:calcineurin-like phosphoesterase family protein
MWFTSDEHYSHENIIKYCDRPFDSVTEMNEAMIANHNLKVGDDDIVYHLGDLHFGKWRDFAANIAPRLRGAKHFLILGNHDPSIHAVMGTLKKWSFAFRIFEVNLGGVPFTLSHYPLESWHASFHGGMQLFGHVHGQIPFDPRKRRMDVGVDCNDFTPVLLDDIIDKLSAVPTPKELFSANPATSEGEIP